MNIKFIKRITCFSDFLENMFNFTEILSTMIRTLFWDRFSFLYEYGTYMHEPSITVTSNELKFDSFLKLNQNTGERVI